ncbi:MAG: hypothetical protein K5829_11215 [Treponema sp.]|nr:hypothetical protein [Treponema sp.]
MFRFPKKMYFFYFGVCLFPILLIGPILVFINEISFLQFLEFLKVPFVPLAITVFSVGIPFLFLFLTLKKLNNLDSTSEESIKITNKTAKQFTTLHMIYGILNGIIAIFITKVGLTFLGIEYDTIVIAFVSISNTFLYALCPYIIFMQTFENNISSLEFKSEFRSMPLVIRNTLVVFFASTGLLLIAVAPTLVSKNIEIYNITIFLTKVIPLAVIASFATILDNYLLARGITKRVNEITNFTNELVNCNYTQNKLEVHSRDEFGLLINDLNDFFKITKDLLLAISESVAISTDSADGLSHSMDETSSTITQIVASIESVKEQITNQSAGVEEAQATVNNMVNHIRDLENQIEVQASSVSDSSSAIEEMVANVRSVTEILNKNSKTVRNLGTESENGRRAIENSVEQAKNILEKSSGLLEATKIIQNIAQRTNLLAMNAAIEAAHAGDAGKGFAVVSDEIRKLAEQSNNQGKTINTQLEELQNAISEISSVTYAVQEQFNIIYELTDTVRNQEEVIMHAMQEQSAGGTQVLEAIKTIKSTTESVQSGSTEITENGKEVADEIQILTNVTQKINDSIKDIAEGAQDIIASVTTVNEDSSDNKANLDSLSLKLKQFKVN